MLDREDPVTEAFYSQDGTRLVLRDESFGNRDIYGIRPGMDSVAVPLVATEFLEVSPALSPNGRWLAYVSNDTGRLEIYVSPFPDAGSGLVQVSTDWGV